MKRLKLAWHVLLGRPAVYRVTFTGGALGWGYGKTLASVETTYSSVRLPVSQDWIASGLTCATHMLRCHPDVQGNYICPMDGEVIAEAVEL